MRLSAWVAVSDLIPHKKTFFEGFILRKFINQSIFIERNPNEVLSIFKKNGVGAIELLLSSKTSDSDLQKINHTIKKLNMRIFSIHQPLSVLFNIKISKIESFCRIAKKLEALVLVLHINVIGKQIFDKEYVDALKTLEKEYSIKIAVENMPKSLMSLFKTYSWREKEFVNVIKKTDLHITLDTTHLAQTGKDIISFYKNNKERIVNIHLSDYKKHFLNTHLLLTNRTHLPLGKGHLPIKELLQILKKDNYKGLITMEINGNLEELCQSAELIKSNF